MLNTVLAGFYERDLRRLMEEVRLFKNEEDLWRTAGSVKNSSGNLVLHLIGGLNFLIGTKLGNTGYVRNRDLEFSEKGVERKELLDRLEALIAMIKDVVGGLSQEQLEGEYPMIFDGEKRSVTFIMLQLLGHMNYHLGQVNYLRRVLDQGGVSME